MIIGKNIIEFESLDSTNLYLNQLLKNANVEEGTVVLAKEQTAGRGQLNNTWESQFGENLLLSLVLYPNFLHASTQFILSKLVSLAIYDTLSGYLKNISIKWPNDIYVENKKIAGVLIENSLRGTTISSTIVGIGLNVNQTVFNKFTPNPTSIKSETNKLIDLSEVRDELFKSLENWYNILKNGNGDQLDFSYINLLYQRDVYCQYSDENGIFKAKITGVDEDGRLCMINSEGKIMKYSFKEVNFL